MKLRYLVLFPLASFALSACQLTSEQASAIGAGVGALAGATISARSPSTAARIQSRVQAFCGFTPPLVTVDQVVASVEASRPDLRGSAALVRAGAGGFCNAAG